jgi:predicted DNA-binding transcriptional regulator YafY
VNRIERLTVSEDTFRRTRELPDNLFSQSMGVFWGEPERIDLEFTASVAAYVRGRVWHESQEIRELPDGRLGMVLNVSNDWALLSWLLGFGAGVRVVAPPPLAAALREEFARALAVYDPRALATPPGRAS